MPESERNDRSASPQTRHYYAERRRTMRDDDLFEAASRGCSGCGAREGHYVWCEKLAQDVCEKCHLTKPCDCDD
jgi:hypothetical protein